MRSPALETLFSRRIVPVVVIDRADHANRLADALIAGGLPTAEITLRTPASIEAIRTVAMRGDILVGAGTVLTPSDVDMAVDAGAQFLVSPVASESVVARARHFAVPIIPGVMTPTDTMMCFDMGIETVKLFPAGPAGGVLLLDALASVFPGITFMPTGGIDIEGMAEYLSRESVVAVGGSWLAPRSEVLAGNFDQICMRTAEAVARIRALEAKS